MDAHNKSGKYSTDTFTNTSSVVFKIITTVFLIYNLFTIKFSSGAPQYEAGILLSAIISAFYIVLICFVQPTAFRTNEKYGFAVNIIMAVCLGFLTYIHKTPVLTITYFTSMIVIGLGFPVSRSIILSSIYYLAYIIPIVLAPYSASDTVLYDIHVLIIFAAISYLCYYFSVIENEKMKQDEVIMELMDERAKLFKDLGCKNNELDQTYWDMVETLIEVIGVRDNCTGGHSVKVCEYSVKMARKLGFDESQISNVMKASILHDIGKMGIPDNILLKPGSLNDEEYNAIMNHPEIGCRLLGKIKGLEDVVPMILYHHERVDGTGYPYGIGGEKIPIGAKIISIADAYDAMTSNRPYRKALLKKEARKRLVEASGTQFDSQLVQRFMDIIGEDNVEDIRNRRYIESI